MVRFINSNPQNKWEDKKKEQRHVTYYGCGEPGHYKTDCPSLNKRKSKQTFYKMKGHKAKGCRAYISWEDDENSSCPILSSYENELTHLCSTTHSYVHFKPSYKYLSNDFQ